MVVINWTDRAREDLDQLYEYWSGISPNSVKIQMQRIFKAINIIETFPESGRIVPEIGHQAIREHIVGYYRLVYYIVSDSQIDILLVHHSARPLDVNEFN